MNRLARRKWLKLQRSASKDYDPELLASVLSQAIHLHRQHQWESAQKLYQQILNVAPDHAKANHLLGLTWIQTGDLDQAYPFLAHAAKLCPDDPDFVNSLGTITLQMGAYREAIEILSDVTREHPHHLDAHHNISLAYHKTGQFQQAIDASTQVLNLDSSFSNAHATLIQAYLFAYPPEAWESILKSLENKYPFKLLQINECLINQGISAWILGNFTALQRCLETFVYQNVDELRISYGPAIVRYVQAQNAYYQYLQALMADHARHPHTFITDGSKATQTLYVVGDSHCLSPRHTPIHWKQCDFKVKPLLIKGIKAWHLSNAEENEYKAALQLRLQEIPNGSTVFFVIGEIDLRWEEGLWPYCQKQQQDPLAIAQQVAEHYVQYIEFATESYDFDVTIVGTPTRHRFPFEFTEMARLFNEKLKTTALDLGWGFLDIHQLTAPLNHSHQLDEIHLKPSAFQVALIEQTHHKSIS